MNHNNTRKIQKIDMISLEVSSNLLEQIPDTNLTYTVGRIGNMLSKTIILNFTNQTDRDQLHDLLMQNLNLD